MNEIASLCLLAVAVMCFFVLPLAVVAGRILAVLAEDDERAHEAEAADQTDEVALFAVPLQREGSVL